MVCLGRRGSKMSSEFESESEASHFHFFSLLLHSFLMYLLLESPCLSSLIEVDSMFGKAWFTAIHSSIG